MSTRCFVGIQLGDKIRAVFVHYDGYLSGVGRDLQEHTSQESVEKLISYGDRSSLNGGFYKDRGEDNVEPVDYESFDEFFEACKNSWGEYYYVFKDGVWNCGTTYKPSVLGTHSLYKSLTPYSEAVKIDKDQ